MSFAVGGIGRRKRKSALALSRPRLYEAIVVSRKKLHPSLYAGLAFAYFADLLETLVICENQEENAK